MVKDDDLPAITGLPAQRSLEPPALDVCRVRDDKADARVSYDVIPALHAEAGIVHLEVAVGGPNVVVPKRRMKPKAVVEEARVRFREVRVKKSRLPILVDVVACSDDDVEGMRLAPRAHPSSDRPLHVRTCAEVP